MTDRITLDQLSDMPEDSQDATGAASSSNDESSDGVNVFAALGLDPRLVAALARLGYEEPTPIQREAIPPLLSGRDLMGQAATGTGKTAAFALPLLQRVAEARATSDGPDDPLMLVLVPTRELAMQVAEAIHKYGKGMGTRVLSVYGGTGMEQQLRALRRGVDVVVATPGRALDHVRRNTLRLDGLIAVVLDEADEMLDMGFEEDLQAILEAAPEVRQTALFSATMAPRIAAIARKHLSDPVQVRIAREAMESGTMPRVRQTAYIVPRNMKLATLGRVLDVEDPTSAIIFCRTRTEVDELTESLMARGWRPEALHGGFSQEQRDRVMRKFRAGTADLLVATDVAARGLDIEHVSHVVNYDVPNSPEAYVHRIGRTGRAGREGVAITIAEPREHRVLRNVEHLTKQKIELATVPTAADLRARRLELVRASLRELLVAGGLDGYRVVVESLGDEFDMMDVAAAAVRMAHESGADGGRGNDEEIDIPQWSPNGGRGPRAEGRTERFGRPERTFDRTERSERPARGERPERGAAGERAERRPRKEVPWETTRLWIGAGRQSGVRPADLVGAIANEVGVDSSVIGAIEIADRFSLVEVPEEIAEDVVTALRATTIKGKKVAVRRDLDASGERTPRESARPARTPYGDRSSEGSRGRSRDDARPRGRSGPPSREAPRGRGKGAPRRRED